MRIPSPHCVVPWLHHPSGGNPDGPGEVDSHHGVANSPVSKRASVITGICKFISTLNQRFQPAYCPIDFHAPGKAQVPALEHQYPRSLRGTQDYLQHRLPTFIIQIPRFHLRWKWTPPPLESEPCCPSNSVSLHAPSLALTTPGN